MQQGFEEPYKGLYIWYLVSFQCFARLETGQTFLLDMFRVVDKL